jgi:hypothetical protein
VIFTTVRVPPTFKLPDKLILPPVIIPADNKVDETVPNELIVEYNVLVEIFVATMFIDVAFVLYKAPEDTLVVANNVAVVIPVVNIPFPEVKVVATAFVTVVFVALRRPEEILVVANNVPVVRPVVNIAFPEVKLVATAFVTVVFVALRSPEETLVVANNVAVVRPVVNIAFPEVKVV